MGRSIQQNIDDVSLALKAGVHPTIAFWVLIAAGHPTDRAKQMLLWAQQINKEQDGRIDPISG